MNRWGILSAILLFLAILDGLWGDKYGAIETLAASVLTAFISLAVARWRSEQAFTARVSRRNERTEA